jgi:uncharacterized C2H2 Zn-finger protein
MGQSGGRACVGPAAPAQQRESDTVGDVRAKCPECGKACRDARHLGVHRRKAHGVAGSSPNSIWRRTGTTRTENPADKLPSKPAKSRRNYSERSPERTLLKRHASATRSEDPEGRCPVAAGKFRRYLDEEAHFKRELLGMLEQHKVRIRRLLVTKFPPARMGDARARRLRMVSEATCTLLSLMIESCEALFTVAIAQHTALVREVDPSQAEESPRLREFMAPEAEDEPETGPAAEDLEELEEAGDA